MRINGTEVAGRLYDALIASQSLRTTPVTLGIVVCDADAVIESFVRIKSRAAAKLGVEILRVDVPRDAHTEDVVEVVKKMSERTSGIIVQLPLPQQIDTETALSAIPRSHDVDGINPQITEQNRLVRAPVAGAVEHILTQNNITVAGSNAVVVGAGRLVGAPVAHLLESLGARVSVVTLESGTLDELQTADIVVLGAGNPGFVKPEMIRDGVVLIDAGTSEAGGKVRGDADPACEAKSALFTPVPGGVGPVAVAMIFENLFKLAELAESKTS